MSNSATPWTVAYHAPPSMEFSRQEYWSGLPFPSPGDLPDPGIKPGSSALQADALPSEPPNAEEHLQCRSPRFDPWFGEISFSFFGISCWGIDLDYCNILAWEISWTEETGGLQPMGSQESDTT